MTSIFQGRDQPVRPPGRSSSAIPTPVGATAVLDQRLRFTGWSREAEELFGLESEEVLGRPADAVLADTETGAGVSAAGGGGAAWSLGPGRSAVVTAARYPCPCLSPRSPWGRARPGGC